MGDDGRQGALVIGTRGSPLARAQADLVCARLAAVHPGREVRIEAIRTSGDRFLDRTLAEIGGKGLFTKEIEEAMLTGGVDVAVHSMKDLPTVLPDGLVIAAMLQREDPRDVLIAAAKGVERLADLPRGARLGTASLRRQAQTLHLRPDVSVGPLRGNVATRLGKLRAGEVDATFLALAGLKRLDMAAEATAVLDPEEMLPAVGQGAIGIECRASDEETRTLLAALDDGPTRIAVTAERALLDGLDGSCRTPIAALAELDGGGGLTLRARVLAPDGSQCFEARRAGGAADAAAMGREAAAELRGRAGEAFFEALRDA